MGSTYDEIKAPPPPSDANMRITLLVNARGRVCLLHDQPFEATPLWLRYKAKSRHIELIFDNNTLRPLLEQVIDQVHSFLLQEKKVMIIRCEGNIPVEGFDTQLILEQDK